MMMHLPPFLFAEALAAARHAAVNVDEVLT
jgi:hypothetical protein